MIWLTHSRNNFPGAIGSWSDRFRCMPKCHVLPHDQMVQVTQEWLLKLHFGSTFQVSFKNSWSFLDFLVLLSVRFRYVYVGRLFFPEGVWAQDSSNSGGLSLIFTSSHLHIFSSSHLLIFTSSHLHIFSLHIFSLHIFPSSHLPIFTSSHFTSSHLHIFSSSHLLIFASSHLLIFTSSHPHIFSSSHLHIFTSSHLHIFSSCRLLASCPLALFFTSSHPHIFTSSSHLHILTSSHLHIFSSCPLALLPSCPLALLPSCPSCPSCPFLLFYFSSEGGGRGSANETARNATLSHEMRFDRQKLR